MLINRMLTLQVISRRIAPYSEATRHQLHTAIKLLSASSSNSSDTSDSSSDSDNESGKSELKSVQDVKQQSDKTNLNDLSKLGDELNKKTESRIDVAIPKRPPKPVSKKEPVATEESKFEEKFLNAAKTVANTLGGDTKKTEMELLDRLLKTKIKSDGVQSETSNQSNILMGMKSKYAENRAKHVREVSQKIDNLQMGDTGSTMHTLLKQRRESIKDGEPDEKISAPVKMHYPSSTLTTLLKENKLKESFRDVEPDEEKISAPDKIRPPSSTIYSLLKEKQRKESFRDAVPDEEISAPGKIHSPSSTIYSLLKEKQRKESFKEAEPDEEEISAPGKIRSPNSTIYSLLKEKQRMESFKDAEPGEKEISAQVKMHSPSSTIHTLLKEQRRAKFLNSGDRSFGILEIPAGEPTVSELSTWAHLEERDMKLLNYMPPQNYFQEMIQWTEQGKVWKFPIDNEQGMEEEQSVHFSQHVFMERHLKGWCPKQGPVRHFMELVCVGLSKNAFMTVDEKIEHIMWYKDYFGDKRDLLQEVGALDSESPSILPKPTNKIDLGPHP